MLLAGGIQCLFLDACLRRNDGLKVFNLDIDHSFKLLLIISILKI